LSADAADVLRLELLLGAVQQNAEIVAIDSELAADLVAVAFVQKNSVEQGAVARGQVEQNLADLVLDLAGRNDIQGACASRLWFWAAFLVQRIVSAGSAVVLQKYMIANGVDKGAKALGLAQAAVPPENRKDACECFLAHVFDCVQGLETGAELYLDELGKVCNEVLLRLAVTCA
jgi:hypothetical protein